MSANQDPSLNQEAIPDEEALFAIDGLAKAVIPAVAAPTLEDRLKLEEQGLLTPGRTETSAPDATDKWLEETGGGGRRETLATDSPPSQAKKTSRKKRAQPLETSGEELSRREANAAFVTNYAGLGEPGKAAVQEAKKIVRDKRWVATAHAMSDAKATEQVAAAMTFQLRHGVGEADKPTDKV